MKNKNAIVMQKTSSMRIETFYGRADALKKIESFDNVAGEER